MIKKFLFCLLKLIVCAGLFAQQPVVAVAPFNVISGVSEADANSITNIFFNRLSSTRQLVLVDRSIVERVLREHNFQLGDWSNFQKTAEIGLALNADWIVKGELSNFGSNILLSVQFFDINTFRLISGDDIRFANVDDSYDKMSPLVEKLLETIWGAESRPRVDGSSGLSNIDARSTNPIAIEHYERGYIFSSRNDWDTAILEYTEAIMLDPNFSYAYLYRGIAYYYKNDLDQSISDYTQAIRLNPDYGKAYEYRGTSYYLKNNYDQSISDYTNAIQLDPYSASAYAYRGSAYLAKGDGNRAIRDLETALQIDPQYEYAENWLNRLTGYTQIGMATIDLRSNGLVAAHPSLPIDSKVLITNVMNGIEIVVTIISRIPPSDSRIVDLSQDSARSLDLKPGDRIILRPFPVQ